MAKALLLATGLAFLLSLAVALNAFAAPYIDSGIASFHL